PLESTTPNRNTPAAAAVQKRQSLDHSRRQSLGEPPRVARTMPRRINAVLGVSLAAGELLERGRLRRRGGGRSGRGRGSSTTLRRARVSRAWPRRWLVGALAARPRSWGAFQDPFRGIRGSARRAQAGS